VLGPSGSTLAPVGFGETTGDCGSAAGAEAPDVTTSVVGPEGTASGDGIDVLSAGASIAAGAAAEARAGAAGWAAGGATEGGAAGCSRAAIGLAALAEARGAATVPLLPNAPAPSSGFTVWTHDVVGAASTWDAS
jgi:hypothetical protein